MAATFSSLAEPVPFVVVVAVFNGQFRPFVVHAAVLADGGKSIFELN